MHVGLHKTGSTSIQSALRRALKSAALIPRPDDKACDRAVFQRLHDRPRRVTVISDETLLGSPFDGYAQVPSRVRLLARAFGQTPYRLVIYLRPQLGWLESVYVQHVQGGGTDAPEHLASRILESPYVKWSRLLELLESESGAQRVTAKAYLPGRDVVSDFFALAGIAAFTPRRLPRVNSSIAASQIPLMRAINEARSITRDQGQVVRGVLQDLMSATDVDLSPLPEELQHSILVDFHDDWASLSQIPACQDDAQMFINSARHMGGVRRYAGISLEERTGRDELARVLYELSDYRLVGARSLRDWFFRRLGE